jgi:UDP-N-acetylmuramate dehydrogenase
MTREASAGLRLADLTTLRLGGPAREVVTAQTQDELVAAVREVDARGERLLVVGGGSNLVVADDGFDGVVVLVRTRGVEHRRAAGGAVELVLAAGEPWDDLVATTVEQGLAEVAALSGIPGLVGATPIQNVGAYGQEIAAAVRSVRVLDRRDGELAELAPAECGFAYRDSRFKHDPALVVLAVTLALTTQPPRVRYAELARALGVQVGDTASASAVRDTVLRLRRSKGMVLDETDPDTRSAGSFFTNPVLAVDDPRLRALPEEAPRYPGAAQGTVKVSAAWLIEQAGIAKGFGRGDARISTKHSLALTNRGDATTADLLAVAGEVVSAVRARFGVDLAPEPVLVGCALPG